MKHVFYLFVILFSPSIQAQQTNCSCEQVLAKLVGKIEGEYPGFSAKTKDRKLYEEFKIKLKLSAKEADSSACQQLLKSYTDFFKDPHLWVGANGMPFSSVSEEGKADVFDIDIKDFQSKVQKSRNQLEGIWTTAGYKIGIKKHNENAYVGFIIEAASKAWKPKEIKFKLFADGHFEYALLDKSIKYGNYQHHDEGVIFLDEVNVMLVKQMQRSAVDSAKLAVRTKEFEGFYFKQLSQRTAILKLPSFEYHHLKEIDQLIEENSASLANTENLIIDLRGNPGGTTDAYQKLLPYIMDRNIRNTGAEFLATKTYIDNLEKYKQSLAKDVSTAAIDQKIAAMRAKLGTFVNFNGEATVQIQEVKLAHKSPSHVVVLANKGTGSSAEYFLFVAKQSKKVKLMGLPSYGALDYGNAYYVDFGCVGYQLLMPTYRALRLPDYPIDNIGFQPDIHLDKSVKDWVGFALGYLEDQ